jgi:hypothetical protein
MSKPDKCEMCEINKITIQDLKYQIETLNDKISIINPLTLNKEIEDYLTNHDNLYFLPDDIEHKVILTFMLHYMNIKH